MPRRKRRILPTRAGFCVSCRKDMYDQISAQLAKEYFSLYPHRGSLEVKRVYQCPHNPRVFHLTSEEQRTGFREIQHSA